ncbi:hypothetical protein GE21DRAFT_1088794 [Neurospora crassa]|nr:hypothetical protein GE21DRAFT_1088794 [Neurospora crassa]
MMPATCLQEKPGTPFTLHLTLCSHSVEEYELSGMMPWRIMFIFFLHFSIVIWPGCIQSEQQRMFPTHISSQTTNKLCGFRLLALLCYRSGLNRQLRFDDSCLVHVGLSYTSTISSMLPCVWLMVMDLRSGWDEEHV